MKDYKDLIRQLRECGDNCDNCQHYPKENCMFALMEEAANAIEELTKESLSEDGTLFVETGYDMAKIGRIHVRKRGTHAGGMFYVDKPLTPWISVKDRLPRKTGMYLAYEPNIGAFQSLYEEKEESFGYWLEFYTLDGLEARKWEKTEVTHWMPLPEPPEEEK